MGLRFRQRIRVFPGVYVNVSLGGLSVSMGGPGATVNIGTGLSYQGTMHPGVRQTGNTQPKASSYEQPQALGWSDGSTQDAEPFEALPTPLMGNLPCGLTMVGNE